jgi:hypothetical protein
MTRSILARTAYSAAVVLALGFGVREAVGRPLVSLAQKPYCNDNLDCVVYCEALYPEQTTRPVCTPGHTCYCL